MRTGLCGRFTAQRCHERLAATIIGFGDIGTAPELRIRPDAQVAGAPVLANAAMSPLFVAVADATERLVDGMLVEVDGTAGTVTVLEAAPPA